jgi:hypothetical protein
MQPESRNLVLPDHGQRLWYFLLWVCSPVLLFAAGGLCLYGLNRLVERFAADIPEVSLNVAGLAAEGSSYVPPGLFPLAGLCLLYLLGLPVWAPTDYAFLSIRKRPARRLLVRNDGTPVRSRRTRLARNLLTFGLMIYPVVGMVLLAGILGNRLLAGALFLPWAAYWTGQYLSIVLHPQQRALHDRLLGLWAVYSPPEAFEPGIDHLGIDPRDLPVGEPYMESP